MCLPLPLDLCTSTALVPFADWEGLDWAAVLQCEGWGEGWPSNLLACEIVESKAGVCYVHRMTRVKHIRTYAIRKFHGTVTKVYIHFRNTKGIGMNIWN